MRHLALVSVPTAFLATIFLAAHSSAAPLAYILADGLLYVVDTMTNSVTTTVMLNDPAYGVAVNRAGSRVYFAGSRGGAPNGVLQVLDTATNTVSGTVTVGNGATGVTVNPAGTRVYVTAQSENRLYVVDATSNAVIATVPVDSDASGVVTDASGSRVYVVNGCAYVPGCPNGTVSVIDSSNNTRVATIPVGDSPSGIAISPFGFRVYVPQGNGVAVIDTSTNTVVDTISVPSSRHGIAVNPAGTRVYVAYVGPDPNSTPGTVSVVDTATDSVIASLSVGRYPLDLAVTPSGGRAYVTNYFEGTFSVIDAANNSVVATVPIGYSPQAFGGQFIGGPCMQDSECNDDNPCTSDACDTTNGCTHSPVNCDDGDVCTADACDVSSGCTYAPVAGCVPPFTASARRCQSAIAVAGIRFANAVHRALSICLDAMLADGSAAARSECMRRLDPTNGNSAVERTRASLAGRVAPKCIGVSPADVSSPCDPRASSLDAVVSCVLNADSSSVQRMIAAEYRDACAMLPAVGLGAAFPAVCAGP